MKKGGCCLVSLIMILVLLGGTVAAGYFGGNYLMQKYIGDEGEWMQLGINNWGDLIDFLSGVKNIFTEEPEIDDADIPSEQNLNLVKSELESSIMGYDPETQLFDIENIVFKRPLRLTGGQLAALIQEELSSQEESNELEFRIAQVKLEVEPDGESYCVITFTMVIDKEVVEEPIKENLGFFGDMLLSGMSDIYITSVNKYIIDPDNPGKMIVDDSYGDNDLFLGSGDSSAINEQIIGLMVSLFEASSKEELNANFGSVVSEAVNNIGHVSFDYDQGVSYLVFDNPYNNDLIYQLIDIAELDISQYEELEAEDVAALAQIKDDINQLLGVLASTPLDEETTPNISDVQNAVNNVENEFNDFNDAYQSDPHAVDLTNLQNAVDALKALFD
ncbi:MAG: hypothetical protein GX756_02705 [Clostridiales bacterium]|nr:hypothetical protein [Clostridiales bacterium]